MDWHFGGAGDGGVEESAGGWVGGIWGGFWVGRGWGSVGPFGWGWAYAALGVRIGVVVAGLDTIPRASETVRWARKRAVESLQFAHDTFMFLLDDVAVDSWDARQQKTPDSVEWLLSHLTAYYRYCTLNLGGEVLPLPAVYEVAHPSMFDEGKRRRHAGLGVVSRARLLRHHAEAFEQLLKTAKGLTSRGLVSVPRGSMSEYAPDRLACIERAVWHEGWHTSQLAAVRRARGLPLKFE